MKPQFLQHGFLPEQDPQRRFSVYPELAVLDELGNDLPSLLQDGDFRKYARGLSLPLWPEKHAREATLAELRLYYVRLGFLASAYINQVEQEPVNVLPKNIAVPLVNACRLLERPPILSYDGYALYNWKRFNALEQIALGNIDTIQNFVHMYDERWFILVHVEIEALAASVLSTIHRASLALEGNESAVVNDCLRKISESVWRQVKVLERIPEKMDPRLYHQTFRPYIRFFDNVIYEGIAERPMNYRGETGAQSSIMPTLIAFMKIEHQPSALTNHLADMRRFMPAAHRELIAEVEALPDPRPLAARDHFNEVLEAMAVFREIHYRWAQEYIHQRAADPRGTGGTPYMKWLKQLIDETREHMIR